MNTCLKNIKMDPIIGQKRNYNIDTVTLNPIKSNIVTNLISFNQPLTDDINEQFISELQFAPIEKRFK